MQSKRFENTSDPVEDVVVYPLAEEVPVRELWLRAKTGYQLHDPEQDVVVLTVATKARVTSWVEAQLAAGLIEECEAPAAAGGE